MKVALEAIVYGLIATTAMAGAANITSQVDSDPSDTIQKERYADTKSCSSMKNTNWDNIKYACSWSHFYYGSYFNLFFKGYDGLLRRECHCRHDLVQSYGSWGSRWTGSRDGAIDCFTRDGKQAWVVKNEFNAIPNCPEIPVVWRGDDGRIDPFP